jgi:hypothetical protein
VNCLSLTSPSFVDLVVADLAAMACVASAGFAAVYLVLRNLERIRTWLASTRDSKS